MVVALYIAARGELIVEVVVAVGVRTVYPRISEMVSATTSLSFSCSQQSSHSIKHFLRNIKAS